ncbi:MAG: tRNA lysidine(34) synthetase TilS [Hyphomicrobiales bacterium]
MVPPRAPPLTRLDRLFDETVARDGLIAAGDSILVAVSGGPDSVALLHLLRARAERYRLHLGVAHLDHGLREESGRDAEFVQRMAAGLGLSARVEKIDVARMQRQLHLSLEEAARKARYDFFQRTAGQQGYTMVALGHHADDNAETLLLHLLRGGGRLGLGGIRSMRQGVYIRPLIRAGRNDIEDYLRSRGLVFLKDRTNTDSAMLRNRIRHRLIPLLESDYRQGVRATLSRTAEVLAAEEEWIEDLLRPVFEQLITDRRPGRLALAADGLDKLPLAAARRMVRSALRISRGDLSRIGFAHVEQIIQLSRLSGGAGPVYLPGNLRVLRHQGQLVFAQQDPGLALAPPRTPPGDYEYSLPEGGVLLIRETGDRIRLSEVPRHAVADPTTADAQTAFLDRDAVQFPITIRNRRPGDRFYPLGAGGSQKLKKFFSDHKVPDAERRRCPLLVSEGRILWVAGHRVDHQARINPLTRRVLKAEVLVAKPEEVITFT